MQKSILIALFIGILGYMHLIINSNQFDLKARDLTELEYIELAEHFNLKVDSTIITPAYHFYFEKEDRFLSFSNDDMFIVKRYVQKGDLIMSTNTSKYYLISK